MSWPVRMITVEFRPMRRPWGVHRELVDSVTGRAPVIGDMFYAPWYLQPGAEGDGIAPHYYARPEPRRPPLVVVCPGTRVRARHWCIDQKAYDDEKGGWYGAGWTLTGVEPAITASPSINLVGDYHGHLNAGVLSDDVEGRTFPRRPIMESSSEHTEDRRAEDQDGATEQAFSDGILPEVDRRAESVTESVTESVELAADAPATPPAPTTPSGATRLVEAIAPGFDGVRARDVGDQFTIPIEAPVGAWMKVVE